MLNDFRLTELRAAQPLVHCISNIVTANDCANLVLAAGGSPIMAQAPEEMAEIAAAAAAVVLNTGTPDTEKFRACRLAGQAARAAGRPIVLDPVGVGASRWRLTQVAALLEAAPPAILRANLGEAQALLGVCGAEQGVDSLAAAGADVRRAAAMALARQQHTVVLLSGPADLVTDGAACWQITGGSALTRSITGAGCMLSVLCGAFAAVEPRPMQAAALAASFWKACAAEAKQAAAGRGLGSFHAALFDAAGSMTPGRLHRHTALQALD